MRSPAEIVVLQGSSELDGLLTRTWRHIYSGSAAEGTAVGEALDSERTTTNRVVPHHVETRFPREPVLRSLNVSNVLAGVSLLTALGISEGPSREGEFGGLWEPQYLIVANANDAATWLEAGIILQASGAANSEGVASISTPESKIVDRILTERSISQIDSDCLAIADAATIDAVKLVQSSKLALTPQVMFSDDGILVLQWQREDRGVALIFAGDGIASIAFTRPGLRYAENGIDIAVTDNLPERFSTALAEILPT